MKEWMSILWGINEPDLGQSRFGFGVPISPAMIVVGILLAVLVVWMLYRRTTVPTSRPLKTALIVLKSAVLVLLFLCLLRPLLSYSGKRFQKRPLAVVVDNSQSMTIRDMAGGRSRADVASTLLYGENGLLKQLASYVDPTLFRFDRKLQPLSGPADLTGDGSQSFLGICLEQVVEQLAGLSPAGIVLITDGVDTGVEDPAAVVRRIGIPVFSVGIGSEKIPVDAEITRLKTERTVMEGSVFEVSVALRGHGGSSDAIDLLIEDGEQTVASKKVTLDPDGRSRRHVLELTPKVTGPAVYTARIAEQPDEIVVENNRQRFLVNNTVRRARILYIEGHPRHEYKFIRRALEEDPSLQLVSYLQTGPRKYLRQGIDSPGELAAGYPTRREDLFAYDAIVFGDVPRHFFTDDQLMLTYEFVSKRGGGFMMIGGTTAFDETFRETPVADLLPVTLVEHDRLPPALQGGPRRGSHATGQKFKLRLTAEGERTPFLRLGSGATRNRQRWSEMPDLQGLHVAAPAKPGAVVLAVHPELRHRNHSLPVLAYQRFGRGRTMALTTASTWRWQMLMPSDNTSHERFWRQVLRWLSAGSPPRLDLRLNSDAYSAGDNVRIRVRVSDKAYQPVGDATVWVKVTPPDGASRDLQLTGGNGSANGIYAGAFTVQQEGVYGIEVSSADVAGDALETSTHFLVIPSRGEFINAAMNGSLLERMAAAGGGRFYRLENVDRLPGDVRALPSAITITVDKDLWHIPPVLMVLILLLSLEWFIRRRKGMS